MRCYTATVYLCRYTKRLRGKIAPFCRGVIVGCLFWSLPAPAQTASGPGTAKTIFNKRCTACHTFGRGIKVGPDLKGVTARRKRNWLMRFIHSSSSVIESGDRTATSLFRQFKGERMPDWTDLTGEQISAILEYLETDGPERKEPDERDALTATVSETQEGRRLFYGLARLTHGGQACIACHEIRDNADHRGGSLGGDLTKTYLKYGDRALTEYLKHACSLREPEMRSDDYLTPLELFDLKAYLAEAGGLPIPSHVAAAPVASSGSADATKRDLR